MWRCTPDELMTMVWNLADKVARKQKAWWWSYHHRGRSDKWTGEHSPSSSLSRAELPDQNCPNHKHIHTSPMKIVRPSPWEQTHAQNWKTRKTEAGWWEVGGGIQPQPRPMRQAHPLLCSTGNREMVLLMFPFSNSPEKVDNK